MNRHRHIRRDVLFGVALVVVVPAVGGLSVAIAQPDGTAKLARLWLIHAQRSSR
jgi:hypothetical protein